MNTRARRLSPFFVLVPVATIATFAASLTTSSASGAAPRPTASLQAKPANLPAAPLTAADDAAMAAQAPYLALNDEIPAALGSSASELSGTRIDVPNRRFYIYLAGEPPTSIDPLRVRAQGNGISLIVQRSNYSQKQLMTVVSQLAAELASTMPAGYNIALAVDGSGLTLNYPGTNLSSSATSAVDSVAHASGVPIALHSGASMFYPASRQADTSPFYGGAATSTTAGGCTDGFSMYATGNNARFMLSAAHCSNYADGVETYTGAGLDMGATDFVQELYNTSPYYDLSVIRLSSRNSNSGRIYTSSTGSIPIAGYASNGIPSGGNYCISGSVGVPNCNIISGGQIFNVPPDAPHGYYAIYVSSKAGAIICHGDSGGPIYYSNSGYIAAGVVSAVNVTTGCGNAGAVSVVASAINRINGLALLTS